MQQYNLVADAKVATGQDITALAHAPATTEPEQSTTKASGLPTVRETSRLTRLTSRYPTTVVACAGLLLLLSLLAYAVGFPPPTETLVGRAAIFMIGHPVIIAWFLANQITAHFGHIVGQTDAAWDTVFWFALTPYLATLSAIACLKARGKMWSEAFRFGTLAFDYLAVGLVVCMSQMVAQS